MSAANGVYEYSGVQVLNGDVMVLVQPLTDRCRLNPEVMDALIVE